jgi:acetyl esterase/lipase
VRGAAPARGVPLPALFVAIGVDDPYVDQSRAFRESARRLGATVTYAEWPGRHAYDFVRAHAPESLAWIAARIANAPAGSRPRP